MHCPETFHDTVMDVDPTPSCINSFNGSWTHIWLQCHTTEMERCKRWGFSPLKVLRIGAEVAGHDLGKGNSYEQRPRWFGWPFIWEASIRYDSLGKCISEKYPGRSLNNYFVCVWNEHHIPSAIWHLKRKWWIEGRLGQWSIFIFIDFSAVSLSLPPPFCWKQ